MGFLQEVVHVGGAVRMMALLGTVKMWVGYSLVPFPFSLALMWGGFTTLVVSCLMQTGKGAWIIGKNKYAGTLSLYSYITFWSLLVCSRLHLGLMRLLPKKDDDVTEIFPGWYVGGWRSCYAKVSWAAVVDLTCEMPEYVKCKPGVYRSFPTFDGCPPEDKDLLEAADFMVLRRSEGPVLVHCAYGRGRSVTVLCAALVKAGLVANWKEAWQIVKKKRPSARLNARMMDSLQRWQRAFDLVMNSAN
jgi:protein-tyrosine phosphatase